MPSMVYIIYDCNNVFSRQQNFTGDFIGAYICNNYACLQALVNNALTWQSSCVIAINARKTAKSIYNHVF